MNGSPMGSQKTTPGFAISDILELDRNTNQEMDPISPVAPMYPNHDMAYFPRHWPQNPDNGKLKSQYKINLIQTIPHKTVIGVVIHNAKRGR